MQNSLAKIWDDEYRDPQLVSRDTEPQREIVRFLEWVTKNYGPDFLYQKTVVDLGCGIGRNGAFCAEKYNMTCYGYDIASEAINLAQKIFGHIPRVHFRVQSIGEPIDLPDASVHVIIDMMSSHLLSPDERNTYLAEMNRILAPDGIIFVRTFTRDGDRNAQNLLKMFPGEFYDTYVHPDLGITERVFREEDFHELYGLYFDIDFLQKNTGYQRRGNQSYKRRYLVAYLKKRADA